MRLGFVSTHPPSRCAIGVYARNLGRAMIGDFEATSVVVAAERGAEALEDDRYSVEPCYTRDGDYRDDVLRRLAGCDVLHAQYAPDMFGVDDRFPGLLASARRKGMKTVVTLHTVYDAAVNVSADKAARFHRAIGQHADRIVVHHERGMASTLVRQGIPESQVAVIPHGTSFMTLPSRSDAREALGLPSDRVILSFFGFIHLQKNVHTIVEAFLRMTSRAPEAMLVVAGMPWGDRWYNHLYVGAIRARVRLARHRERLRIRSGYVAADDVPRLFAASDVILLPHHQRYGSASGVFHQAIGADRAVLCAAGPKFEDARRLFGSEPGLVVPATSIRRWARAMLAVTKNEALRERSRALVREYAEETAWPRVAARHHDLYATLLGR